MVSKACVLFPLLLLASGPAAAQQPAPGHVDPWPVLQAAAKAMGVDKLNCVTLSGSGYAGKVGQNVTQDTDWPRGEPLANYTRTINYAAKSSVDLAEEYDVTDRNKLKLIPYGANFAENPSPHIARLRKFAGVLEQGVLH